MTIWFVFYRVLENYEVPITFVAEEIVENTQREEIVENTQTEEIRYTTTFCRWV